MHSNKQSETPNGDGFLAGCKPAQKYGREDMDGACVRTVYREIDKGLPHVKVAGKTYIPLDLADRYWQQKIIQKNTRPKERVA